MIDGGVLLFQLLSWWLKDNGSILLGLDNWRRMVSSVMVVIGWLNSEEVMCWSW